MKRPVHLAVRGILHAALVVAVVVPFAPASARPAAAQENSRTINGHKVSDRFLEVWSSHGSDQADIYVNGLPITDVRQEISMTDGKTYDTQWFERARYEAHTENKAPYDVLLGLLGVTLTEGRPSIDPATKQPKDPADRPFMKVDKPTDADGKTKEWFGETGHTVSGKILEYWNRYGGLAQFGFPLSEQFQEVSPTDGKTYAVQYFQRNRFELHPEKQAPYEVELGLLGVQQYMTIGVPGDQLPVSPPKGVKSSKDTLVFALPNEPTSLIPNGIGNNTIAILQMLFNGNVNIDAKTYLWPGDVYYVPTIENGGAYYVGQGDDRHFVVKQKLRFGLHWSDGLPITSDDLAYTAKYEEQLGSAAVDGAKIASVDTPDPNTAIFNFLSYNQATASYNKPGQDEGIKATLKPYVDARRPVDAVSYSQIPYVPPLPSHVLRNIPVDKMNDSDYARNPVVDGPFKVDRWDRGTQLVLVANPFYSLTAPPLLKRVVVKFISDSNEVISQLKTGDLDAAPYLGFQPPSVLDPLASAGQTVVYRPIMGWEHADFNLDKPQFKEKAVRQAILAGIDRQQIIDKVFFGKAGILNTYVPPANRSSMDNPDFASVWESQFPINDYTFDPVKANKMLDDAGWVTGADGVRAKNGVRLEFDYLTTQDNAARKQISEMVAADLKNLGMQASLKYVPASDLFDDLGPLNKREFDVVEFAWISPGGPNSVSYGYTTEEIPTAGNSYNGQNATGFSNSRFDDLSKASLLELSEAKRAPMFAEMQHIWNDELPVLPLYVQVGVEVHKASLQNWVDTADLYEWSPTFAVAAMYFK